MPVPGRHHAEVVERLLAPAQEEIALAVALVLGRDVLGEGRIRAVGIDLHRVVDDEVDGLKGVDALGVPAHRLERFTHRGEVDDCRHSREVLEEDPRGRERDLALLARIRAPVRKRFDVVASDGVTIFAA